MTTLDREKLIAKLRKLSTIEFGGAAAQMAVEAMREAADALSTIPEQGVGVKPTVKALEWRELPLGNAFSAEPHLGGYYNVYETDAGKFIWLRNGSTELDRTHYQTMPEAKAAAQADYEARILSALVAPSQPAAVGVTDEMVEPGMVRVCPERDARCPHGMNCPFGVGEHWHTCDMAASRAALRSTP